MIIIKKIVLILFVVILAFGFIIIYPVLFQEGNPLPILKGIAKLSFNEDEIVKISDSPQRYISKTDRGKSPIIDLMSQESWEFEDQMGSGYIFYKNGNRKNVSSVQYTKKYIIWELPNDTSSLE